jgi:hypothetical protein
MDPPALHAQDRRAEAIRGHIRALEEAHRSSLEELLSRFQREHLSESYLARTPEAERRRVLEAIRTAAGDAGDVMVEVDDGLYVLTLSGSREYRVSFTVTEGPPFRIEALEVEVEVVQIEELVLTRENLAATFRRLPAQGIEGVAFVSLGGEVLVDEGFGWANEDLGIRNGPETVFGIGSRPMDFTSAAVHLLRQHDRLGLDDPITLHFPDVPHDKREITIRHLMTGRSGLPDFFHEEEDWDPDLAWIDRHTAERRILEQELLFDPGTERRHSHGAFGLLAALVERVSGRTYYDFVREHLLDPAGMDRTGEYGATRGLGLSDFAVGSGPQRVGVPNIPPNWGPTSWLIKGSGGMYSTLGDLRRFYDLVRGDPVFDEETRAAFSGLAVNLDGSDRGFELFSVYDPRGHEVYVFLNRIGDRRQARELFRALERLVGSTL